MDMEAMLSQVSPLQMLIMSIIQIWVVIIFPVIVIRKINYLTALVESQFEEESEEAES